MNHPGISVDLLGKRFIDVISVPCHTEDGDVLTVRDVAIEYLEAGDGLEVTVFKCSDFQEDAIVAISEYLDGVTKWIWID